MVIQSIQNRIYELRGERVMLDFDLAALYEVEIRILNQAVKRNVKRFPSDFMFQLTRDEYEGLRLQIETIENDNSLTSQIVMLKAGRGTTQEIYALRIYRTRRCHAKRHIKQRQSNRYEYCHNASFCRS